MWPRPFKLAALLFTGTAFASLFVVTLAIELGAGLLTRPSGKHPSPPPQA